MSSHVSVYQTQNINAHPLPLLLARENARLSYCSIRIPFQCTANCCWSLYNRLPRRARRVVDDNDRVSGVANRGKAVGINSHVVLDVGRSKLFARVAHARIAVRHAGERVPLALFGDAIDSAPDFLVLLLFYPRLVGRNSTCTEGGGRLEMECGR
jgi:hypothetical protein